MESWPFFGKYSYGLYVVHFQCMIWLAFVVNGHGGLPAVLGSYLPAQLAFAVAATAVSVAVAWLSWHCLEKQFLKLKRFAPYGGRERPASVGIAPAPVLERVAVASE